MKKENGKFDPNLDVLINKEKVRGRYSQLATDAEEGSSINLCMAAISTISASGREVPLSYEDFIHLSEFNPNY